MTKLVYSIAAAIALFVLATPANAQATRTYVSGIGNDADPCSRTAPCRTFAGAISKTARGGEIDALDSGGFGALTITKSISIIAEGLVAGVIVAGTNGIVINITDPADPAVVTLKGLTVEGLGNAPTTPGINGISILSAKVVNIENCLIRGFKDIAAGNGINVNPASVGTKVAISNTKLESNTRGVRALGSGAGTAQVLLDRVVINAVTRGLEVGTGATVRLNNSVITGANSAIITTGTGKVISFQNNAIAGNAVPANDNPTSTISLK